MKKQDFLFPSSIPLSIYLLMKQEMWGYNGKGISDGNEKFNEIGKGEYNDKEMAGENEKSIVNGEEGYNGKGMNDQKKMKMKMKISTSAEKGNYLTKKEKRENNTQNFLGKKRNLKGVDENDEKDDHGEENNRTKTKF